MYITHTLNGYKFIAKVYNTRSKRGIAKGKVSKLTVWAKDGRVVFNYDRGVDFILCPKSIIKLIVRYCESPAVQTKIAIGNFLSAWGSLFA